MVKNIMRDPLFLSQKSEAATKEDLQIGGDLMDTFVRNSYTMKSFMDREKREKMYLRREFPVLQRRCIRTGCR